MCPALKHEGGGGGIRTPLLGDAGGDGGGGEAAGLRDEDVDPLAHQHVGVQDVLRHLRWELVEGGVG